MPGPPRRTWPGSASARCRRRRPWTGCGGWGWAESPSPALDRLRRRRADVGLPAGDDAPLLIDPPTGTPIAADAVPLHLRKARLTRTSLDANTGICRGMLRHRYTTDGQGEEDR